MNTLIIADYKSIIFPQRIHILLIMLSPVFSCGSLFCFLCFHSFYKFIIHFQVNTKRLIKDHSFMSFFPIDFYMFHSLFLYERWDS